MADVQLPQLGESVAEGVITQWLVEVGDEVTVDQPIVEISTDKVDTEVPSPVAGTVTDIRFAVDDTVEVGQVIAVIGDADAAPSDEDSSADDEGADENGGDDDVSANPEPAPQSTDDEPRERPSAAQPAPAAPPSASSSGRRVQASPLVRRLLREAGIEPADVPGTGPAGRVTRADAEQAIATNGQDSPSSGGPSAAGSPSGASAMSYPAPAPSAPTARERPAAAPVQIDFAGQTSVTQDLSRIRRIIARSMMDSLQSTAQ
ncbi:MAG: biotin/lipoyl-containing protein, partial [Nitriliruptoraceae bacterium]